MDEENKTEEIQGKSEEVKKKREGVSVKELEGYAKKHRFEIFFCLLFVFASCFSLVFWGRGIFSVFFAGVGGIFGVFFPTKVDHFLHKMYAGLLKQEGTMQIIIAIVALIVAIFIAPIIFLLVGLHAGKGMVLLSKEATTKETPHS